ncbi:hypothetical protein ACFLZP_02490 [Patescibacteria group bacterium]
MKNFKLSSLAPNLTAKERAKMLAAYALKQEEEDKDYSKELEDLNSYIPNHQIPEHNFYINILKSMVYVYADLQTAYLHLELAGKQLVITDNFLMLDIIVDNLCWQMRHTPQIATRHQFDQWFEEIREKELSAVFSLEQLAKHEALKRLKQEGSFDKKEDIVSIEEELEENANKTAEQMLENHVASTQKGIKKYQLLKRRKSPLASVYEDYKPSIGLTVDQLKGKLKEKYDYQPPNPERVSKWQQAVTEEKNKLEQLVQKGVLIEGVVGSEIGWYGTIKDKGQKGITAQSWYDYEGKQDKSLNEFLSDKDKVVEFHKGPLAVEISPYSDKEKCYGQENQQRLVKTLTKFKLIKLTKNKESKKVLNLKKETKDNLTSCLKDLKVISLKSLAYIRAIKRIEKCYFDNHPIISRKTWFGTRAKKAASRIVDNHNQKLTLVINYYNRFNTDQKEITFPKINQFWLRLPKKAEKKETNEVVDLIIKRAIESSKYSPPILP